LALENESNPMTMMIDEDYELNPLFHAQIDAKCFEVEEKRLGSSLVERLKAEAYPIIIKLTVAKVHNVLDPQNSTQPSNHIGLAS
jgi:hypothetical protein